MSSFRRPRPLTRSSGTFRDDRLFIVACDDQYAPKQYFGLLRLTRVQVHIVPTEDGTSHARHVLARLKQIEHDAGDERWMLLDTDHCLGPDHIQSFLEALKEARDDGIRVALSRPCFEFWLALHFMEPAELGEPTLCRAVEETIRARNGEYNKRSINTELFAFEAMTNAFRRASALDATVPGGEIPKSATSRVYQLLGSIIGGAVDDQLPPGLRPLAQELRRNQP